MSAWDPDPAWRYWSRGGGAAEPQGCGECRQAQERLRPTKKQSPRTRCGGFGDKGPGDDLLSHGLSHTTIGAGAFHFRVRDGIGWDHTAMVAEQRVEQR